MQKSKQVFRVALLGIYHESNTFIDKPTTLQDFKNGHWLKGGEICKEYINAFHELGGMIEVLNQNGAEIIPVMFAEATPGGTVSAATYNFLLEEMMSGLDKVLPVDACLVVPHGAGVAENFADMDGNWLSILRMKVGRDIPIVGTLDPHANVSQLMADNTNALIAYSTNPHIDQRQTGKKAAGLLMEMLYRKSNPTQVLIQAPIAISIEQQNTSVEPCKSLYHLVSDLRNLPGVLSISVLLGFPYADVSEMGSSFIVITDNNKKEAGQIGQLLKSEVINNRNRYLGEKKQIQSQLNEIASGVKPVLLLDMGDNIGAGSPGDSTVLLEALENDRSYKSFICIYDPAAVEKSSYYEKGNRFELSFGSNPVDGTSYTTEVILLDMRDGQFSEEQPRHGGQVNYDMGKVAIVSTSKGNTVMLISQRIAPFSLRQLTSFGIMPGNFDVIIAKGVNAPIAAYSPVCPTIIQIDTPGVTQADMTLFNYSNRRKPLFPFEDLLNADAPSAENDFFKQEI